MYVEILIGDTELKRGKIKSVISKTTPKDGLIRVELVSGDIGKCVKIISKDEIEIENFKFFNLFLHNKYYYSLYNNEQRQYFFLERTYKHNIKARNLMLFSSKERAEETLNKSNHLKNNYNVVRLNPNKKLSDIVKDIPCHLLIIDLSKVITKNKLKELENKLK